MPSSTMRVSHCPMQSRSLGRYAEEIRAAQAYDHAVLTEARDNRALNFPSGGLLSSALRLPACQMA